MIDRAKEKIRARHVFDVLFAGGVIKFLFCQYFVNVTVMWCRLVKRLWTADGKKKLWSCSQILDSEQNLVDEVEKEEGSFFRAEVFFNRQFAEKILVSFRQTHCISLWGVSIMHFHALFLVVKRRGWPVSNDDPDGPASCKCWSGGIGDSRSCMKIDIFLCKIRFRTHIIII